MAMHSIVCCGLLGPHEIKNRRVITMCHCMSIHSFFVLRKSIVVVLYCFEENGPSERNFMTIDIIISAFVMRWLRRNHA